MWELWAQAEEEVAKQRHQLCPPVGGGDMPVEDEVSVAGGLLVSDLVSPLAPTPCLQPWL